MKETHVIGSRRKTDPNNSTSRLARSLQGRQSCSLKSRKFLSHSKRKIASGKWTCTTFAEISRIFCTKRRKKLWQNFLFWCQRNNINQQDWFQVSYRPLYQIGPSCSTLAHFRLSYLMTLAAFAPNNIPLNILNLMTLYTTVAPPNFNLAHRWRKWFYGRYGAFPRQSSLL